MALVSTTELPMTLTQEPVLAPPAGNDPANWRAHLVWQATYMRRQQLVIDGLYSAIRRQFARMSMVGLATDLPTAGFAGRLFLATDTKVLYMDTGSAWLHVQMS